MFQKTENYNPHQTVISMKHIQNKILILSITFELRTNLDRHKNRCSS